MMDRASDAPRIKTHSLALRHVPIIDPNPHSKTKKEQLETEAKRRKAANYTLAEARQRSDPSWQTRHNGRCGTPCAEFAFSPRDLRKTIQRPQV